MKKLLLTLVALMALSAPAMATEHETVNIKVLGMVCEFCAESITKVFYKNEGVEKVDINLDDGMVTVDMKPGQTIADEEITKLIEYGGYEVDGIERVQNGG